MATASRPPALRGAAAGRLGDRDLLRDLAGEPGPRRGRSQTSADRNLRVYFESPTLERSQGLAEEVLPRIQWGEGARVAGLAVTVDQPRLQPQHEREAQAVEAGTQARVTPFASKCGDRDSNE